MNLQLFRARAGRRQNYCKVRNANKEEKKFSFAF